jgi:hypothetical protein
MDEFAGWARLRLIPGTLEDASNKRPFFSLPWPVKFSETGVKNLKNGYMHGIIYTFDSAAHEKDIPFHICSAVCFQHDRGKPGAALLHGQAGRLEYRAYRIEHLWPVRDGKNR